MRSHISERPASGTVLALALVIALSAAIGYGFGAVGGGGAGIGEMRIYRNVAAAVGDDQMSAMVDGTYYGFDSDVTWTDSSGSFHASGWPTCLPRRSQLHVTFAGALIRTPPGVGVQRILWVDCRT